MPPICSNLNCPSYDEFALVLCSDCKKSSSLQEASSPPGTLCSLPQHSEFIAKGLPCPGCYDPNAAFLKKDRPLWNSNVSVVMQKEGQECTCSYLGNKLCSYCCNKKSFCVLPECPGFTMLEPCKLPKCIIQNQSPKGEEILADGKYMSSIVPRHELIPRTASLRKIRRYEYGEQKKGKYAWNALSKNQEVLLDKDLLIKRLGHVIEHCQSLLHKLITDAPLIDFSNPVDEHDDAAAIAWGGDFAICATEAMEERKCTLGPTNTKRY